MPITRKQQVLAAIELSEGTPVALGANDAVQVFEPSISDEVDVQDRVPAGPTLSRDFAPIGRQTRTITFRSDFRGNGDITTPPEPDWGKFLQASGYKLSASMTKLTLGAVTGSIRNAGGTVWKSRSATSGDLIIVAPIAGATLAAAATTGESSASTSSVTPAAAYDGRVYQTTSQKLVNITVGSWTAGSGPVDVGEVIKIESPAGTIIGACQIINDNGSMLDMDVTLLYGALLTGYQLRAADGVSIATVLASPSQIRTPSLTIGHNLDGRSRNLNGARGDFTLEGEVGQPMQFTWTFSGDLGAAIDELPIVTSGLSTIRPPRLLGAMCVYGNGAVLAPIATKRVSFANGGTVNPNLDANRPGGATGSNVTDRDPAITVTVDQVHSAFDWEAARSAGTVIRAAFILGTAPGNVMSLVAPVCQVTEIAFSDSDGIATFDVTLRPRRVLESGDDEVFLAQL